MDFELQKNRLRGAVENLSSEWPSQNNEADNATRFIYDAYSYDELLCKARAKKLSAYYMNYALHRWYNRVTSEICENIFSENGAKKATIDENIKMQIDIFINDIPFDVKLTVFPDNSEVKKMNLDLSKQSDKDRLIHWFYDKQSKEQRGHANNRIFVVCKGLDTVDNYQLKQSFNQMNKKIKEYMEELSEKDFYFNEYEIYSKDGKKTKVKADLIVINADENEDDIMLSQDKDMYKMDSVINELEEAIEKSDISSEQLDTMSREQIVSYSPGDLDKNYLVEAGAGSGKTESLSDRIVALIENGEKIENICVISFTNSSVDTFANRLKEKLKKRADGEFELKEGIIGQLPIPQDEKTKALIIKRCSNAYKTLCKYIEDREKRRNERLDKRYIEKNSGGNLLDSCFLGTMDSFCFQFMRKYGEFGKITPVDTKELAKIEYEKIYEEYNNNSDNNCILDNYFMLNDYPEEVFIQGVGIKLDKTEYALYTGEKNPDEIKEEIEQIVKEYENKIHRIYDCLKDIADQSENIIDIIDNQKDAKYSIINSICSSKDISNLKGYITLQNYKDYLVAVNKLFIEGEEIAPIEKLKKTGFIPYLTGMLKLINDCYFYEYINKNVYIQLDPFISDAEKSEYTELYKRIKNLQYCATMHMINEGERRISKLFDNPSEDERIITFTECRKKTRDIIKNSACTDGEIIKTMANSVGGFRHYFIDEFQDTNVMQSEIFFYLAMNIGQIGQPEVADWRNCNARKGALFIVGDPKQSIYAFSGADVNSYKTVDSVFKRYEKNGIGRKLYLTRNFRSANELLKYYNNEKLFKSIFAGTGCEYIDIPINKKREQEVQGVYKYTVAASEKLSNEVKKDAEENGTEDWSYETVLSRIILQLCTDKTGKYMIKDENGMRKISFGDVMIIGRSNKQADQCVEFMNNYGIPVIKLSKEEDGKDIDKVKVTTIHSSKGKESPVVILTYSWLFEFTPSYYIDREKNEIIILSLDKKKVADGKQEENEEKEEQKEIIKLTSSYGMNMDKEALYVYSPDVFDFYMKRENYINDDSHMKSWLMKAFLEGVEENNRLVYVAATRARNLLLICDSQTKLKGKENLNRWDDLLELVDKKWQVDYDLDINMFMREAEDVVQEHNEKKKNAQKVNQGNLFDEL